VAEALCGVCWNSLCAMASLSVLSNQPERGRSSVDSRNREGGEDEPMVIESREGVSGGDLLGEPELGEL
jgi:hypothetical protein